MTQGRIITAPAPFVTLSIHPSVFLAGSIDMGSAPDWQTPTAESLTQAGFNVLNPRRLDWDRSWGQTIGDPLFVQQVEWELSALNAATYIVLYLAPGSTSPISLLELGLYAIDEKLVVVCPEGFLRKGNIDITCRAYGILQLPTLDAACQHLCKEEGFRFQAKPQPVAPRPGYFYRTRDGQIAKIGFAKRNDPLPHAGTITEYRIQPLICFWGRDGRAFPGMDSPCDLLEELGPDNEHPPGETEPK